MRWVLALGVWLLSAAAACGCAPLREEPVSLVEHALWEIVDAADDPFREERHDGPGCDPAGLREEPPVFEIDTGLCDPVTLSQPLLDEVRPGELVRVVAWHTPLRATEPGRGHLAVVLGEALVFEYWTDIPANEEILKSYWLAEARIEAGTPLYLQVHNHGENSWKLLEITAGAPSAFPDGARPEDG